MNIKINREDILNYFTEKVSINLYRQMNNEIKAVLRNKSFAEKLEEDCKFLKRLNNF